MKKEEVQEEIQKVQKTISELKLEIERKNDQIKELRYKKHSIKNLIYRNKEM